jgi:hypothetical protein
MAVMTKMPESVVAQPRPFSKLPTVHGIVNQKIRYVPDHQAAGGSEGNFDIPEQRKKRKDESKADDAYPNRRANEVVRMRVVHAMELPRDSYLMVDKTMQQIFDKRPQQRSAHKSEPPA